MVFAAIKQLVFGNKKADKSRQSLLPTSESTYRSIDNTDDDFNGTFNNQNDYGSLPTSASKSSFSKCKDAFMPTVRSYETGSDEEYSSSSSIGSARRASYSSDSLSSSSKKSSVSISPRVMSDIIIGLSDGLTVPFALTAGLSSLGNSKLVITGGLAELVSGALSMGLGGYLAAKSESEYYHHESNREKFLHDSQPELSERSIEDILSEYNISPATIKMFINDMNESPTQMIDFIIKFGKGLEEPADGREFTSALTIGAAYFFGGFVPLVPYFFVSTVNSALLISVIVMLITLFIFGILKTTFTLGWDCGKARIVFNGVQMVLTGGVAAGAAWALVRLIE